MFIAIGAGQDVGSLQHSFSAQGICPGLVMGGIQSSQLQPRELFLPCISFVNLQRDGLLR